MLPCNVFYVNDKINNKTDSILCRLGVSPSLVSRWREAVLGGFEDLKFKISEGSDQNW